MLHAPVTLGGVAATPEESILRSPRSNWRLRSRSRNSSNGYSTPSGDNLRLAMRGACVTISKTQAEGVITEVAEWIAGCCGWCEPVMIGRNDDAIVADGTSR